MTTFPAPRTLTQRITDAHATLQQARREGQQPIIDAAERVLNGLLDRLPRWQPLEQADPKLAARLTINASKQQASVQLEE